MASFFRNLLGVETQDAQNRVIQLGMRVRPDLMTAAQIQHYADVAHDAAGVVGAKQQVLDQIKRENQPVIDEFSRYKTAYDRLVAQMESAGINPDNTAGLQGDQKKLADAAEVALTQATKLKDKRKEAQHRIEQAEQDLKDAQSDADRAADQATKARDSLENQKHELERLTQEEAREKDRVHDAQVKAGLSHEIDGMHLVDDAYSKQIEERRQRVAAAHAEAESLRKATEASHPETGNEFLAAALAGNASPAADSRSRRAALDD